MAIAIGVRFRQAGQQDRAERDAKQRQRGEVGDRVDIVVVGDTDEPVGVQVIPQQEGGVAVGRRAQALGAGALSEVG